MKNYDHKKIELKWQKEWEKKKIYQAKGKGKKFYSLIEFPYPSGEGLHVGHPRPYIGMDIISRKRRMEGYNVLYPIGWDAFGLPTENYAIKTGIRPKIIVKKNTDNFRRQIKSLGISFDWSREINTTDPAYYKWTQWIFLQFYKKGLAYKAEIPINWCPKDKIGLANEEVIDGKCERCGTQTERRMKNQWMLAITKYAERLDKDLDLVDYPERVKLSQRNWIGKSEGSEIKFKISPGAFSQVLGSSPLAQPDHSKKHTGSISSIKVFTTRADTLFGATYVVLAPEHPLIESLKLKVENKNEVEKYIEKVKKESELERTAEGKEKTGVELKGIKAINPANNEKIPVWIADYVLAGYGTGAVMAVPAHDERDWDFAKKYNLLVKQVVAPISIDATNPPHEGKKDTKRFVAQCIVRHPTENTFLTLKWNKFPWHTFITGGIEEGEELTAGAVREIKDETGYQNIEFIRKMPISINSHFYAAHKDVNRDIIMNVLEFKLKDLKQIEHKRESYEDFDLVWIKEEQMKDLKPVTELPYILQWLREGDFAYSGEGILIDSNKFSDLKSEEARKKITEFVGGKMVTKFKLRDWVFSRQRYWGEPIPIVNCSKCGLVPVKEKDLPLKLPEVKKYKLTETGESPLAGISKWVNTKCPKCGGKAKRETDTMPNWAGSSWYYLRYTDPKNKNKFADAKKIKYWLGNDPRHGGIDWYHGGMEHVTLHLLYSRFWHKFLYDLKLVLTMEPYMKRTSHGMILGKGGVKMSKSLGNVINPDDIVKIYGADTLRIYEMFIGPFEDTVVWNTESIIGSRRFIEKVWRIGMRVQKRNSEDGRVQLLAGGMSKNLSSGLASSLNKNSLALLHPADGTFRQQNSYLLKLLHKTIKKVSEDIEAMRFNTAISAMMILATEMEKAEFVDKEDFKKFLQILAPFAPHVAEEFWQSLGEKKTINFSEWPKWDENLIKDEEIKIAVQVNGKVRAEIIIQTNENEEEIKKKAMSDEKISKIIVGKEIKKVIYVKNRIINIVI